MAALCCCQLGAGAAKCRLLPASRICMPHPLLCTRPNPSCAPFWYSFHFHSMRIEAKPALQVHILQCPCEANMHSLPPPHPPKARLPRVPPGPTKRGTFKPSCSPKHPPELRGPFPPPCQLLYLLHCRLFHQRSFLPFSCKFFSCSIGLHHLRRRDAPLARRQVDTLLQAPGTPSQQAPSAAARQWES